MKQGAPDRRGRFILLLIFQISSLPILSGCMSTGAQVMYFTADKNIEYMPLCMVYSGTQINVVLIANIFSEGPFKSAGHGPAGIVGIFDFPLSLALDTILLPLTIGETIAGCQPSAPPPPEEVVRESRRQSPAISSGPALGRPAPRRSQG
jgi:uncharacterized protein YceK